MLTSLALVPATDGQRALIATGDRDEHIRVARFPNGHNIERFLFGSTKWVSRFLSQLILHRLAAWLTLVFPRHLAGLSRL